MSSRDTTLVNLLQLFSKKVPTIQGRLMPRLTHLALFLLFFTSLESSASDVNSTTTSRIEVVVTIAGVQETVASIQESSQQIVQLTKQLSNKGEFTSRDQELIVGLTQALNNNAEAINKIAIALPQQFKNAEGGVNNILDTAMINVKEVVSSSKRDLVDPTLSRIENRLLIFVLIISAILFGLLGYVFWKVRGIVSTGSETVGNIMNTVKSLEKVLEKVNRIE